MPHSYGYRARSRSKFSRAFRANGPEHLSTYLRSYKVGDFVDVKANGSIHKGMPHHSYHGKTGRIWNVTPRAVGYAGRMIVGTNLTGASVELTKQVGNRQLRKRIHVRVEHVQPSKCRDQFLARVAKNDAQTRKKDRAPSFTSSPT